MNKPSAIYLPVGSLRRCVSPTCFSVQIHNISSMKALVCWCALTPKKIRILFVNPISGR